jgi:hypothetical protein
MPALLQKNALNAKSSVLPADLLIRNAVDLSAKSHCCYTLGEGKVENRSVEVRTLCLRATRTRGRSDY